MVIEINVTEIIGYYSGMLKMLFQFFRIKIFPTQNLPIINPTSVESKSFIFEVKFLFVWFTGDDVTSVEGILCADEEPLRPNIDEKALLIVFLVFLAS